MTPGGLWDSEKYEISALVKHKAKIIGEQPLSFDSPSTFKGELNVSEKGDYEIIVYAYDPLTGNTGVDKARVKVR